MPEPDTVVVVVVVPSVKDPFVVISVTVAPAVSATEIVTVFVPFATTDTAEGVRR